MKYLNHVLFSICGMLLFLPLNTFAGTLTNVSVELDSHLPSATTTHTYRYTTESSLGGAWPNTVLFLTYNADFAWNFSFDGIQNSDVTVTVNGSPTSIQFLSHSGFGISIQINQSVPAGANVVVVVHNVVNPNHDGSFGFFKFWTSANIGIDMLDTASPTPVIIATPDTTPPVQSSIVATPTINSATISLTTNEAATSSISYGPTSSYGTTTTISGSLVTSHSVTLSGLSACGAVYHYQISTTDAANNTSTSTDATFVTHCGSTSGGSGYSAPLPENPSPAEIPTVVPETQINTPALASSQTSSAQVETSEKQKTPIVIAEKSSPNIATEKVPPKSITAQPYLNSYIKLGAKNNRDDVIKLQVFLNALQGEHLVVDGVYKKVDAEAIKRFQKKYSQAILSYWNINKPTGYVYITTTEMINKLVREKIQK